MPRETWKTNINTFGSKQHILLATISLILIPYPT